MIEHEIRTKEVHYLIQIFSDAMDPTIHSIETRKPISLDRYISCARLYSSCARAFLKAGWDCLLFPLSYFYNSIFITGPLLVDTDFLTGVLHLLMWQAVSNWNSDRQHFNMAQQWMPPGEMVGNKRSAIYPYRALALQVIANVISLEVPVLLRRQEMAIL